MEIKKPQSDSDSAPTGAIVETPWAGPVPTFAPGERVADRFRIVGLLGQGGMGQVYEAEDLELMDRVALKILRPDLALDAQAVERFRREVYLARKVTHPGVCRIFDIFRHRIPAAAPDGREHDVAVVTMQLLPGETLSQRLRRTGPLSTAEALPLVRQMVAALEAAHEAGIVHRDFKPGNVVLVGQGPDIRAVVTDFGLAYSAEGRRPEPAQVQGTAAYMSPEQLSGGAIGPAVDVYALGVTLYEMVTGRLPYEGPTSVGTASKRLKEPPVPPTVHVPDLDAVWAKVILRCLERDPERRFASVLDVERALVGTSAAGRWRRALPWVAAGLALASLGLAFALYRDRSRERGSGPGLTASKGRRSVALIGFKNLSGRPDAAWISTALSELLATELAAGDTLRTVSGEDVARAKSELRLPDADSLAGDTLRQLRRRVGSDLVVLGSYLALDAASGRTLRLDLRIQDAAAGETISIVSETGTEAGLLDLVARAGAGVRERLGVGAPSQARLAEARASQPANPEAARHYADGLGCLRRFDALAARSLLEKAVAADPGHPLAHAALAQAWATLGYDGKAREEAGRALELARTLSREERLSIEGRHHEAMGDWSRAVEVYKLLAGFFPDDLEYGLRLAAAQIASGRGQEAQRTVAALRALPPPAGDDPRVDLAEAEAAGSLSDYRREAQAAGAAEAKAESESAHHLLARAASEEGNALWGMGEADRAVAAFEKARRIFEQAGDRSGVARMINRMAGLPYERGDTATARRMWSEALAISREIGDRRSMGSYLGNIAEALFRLGDLGASEKMYAEALALNRENDRKALVADNLIGRGGVLWARGDLAAAEALYREAAAVAGEIGDRRHRAYALHDLGRLLLERGDRAGSRHAQEEALALRQEMGQRAPLEASRLALAEIALDEGRPSEATPLARGAAEEFAREGFRDYEAAARAVLGQALAGAGDPQGAAAEMARAEALTTTSQNPQLQLTVRVAAARLRTLRSDPTAPARLAAIETEARARGYLSIARRAAARGPAHASPP